MLTTTAPAPPASFEHPADFYQTRDFGQKWEAAAQLLRQHGRPLLPTVLRYAGPWLLLSALLRTWTLGYRYSNLTETYLPGPSYVAYFTDAVGSVVAAAVVYGFLSLRLNLYQSPGYRLTAADVWQATRDTGLYFGKYLSMSLLMLAGLLLMIAPSVYVYVVMALMPGVVFLEQDGLTRTFELIKGHWWQTAALVLTALAVQWGATMAPSSVLTALLERRIIASEGLIWTSILLMQLFAAAVHAAMLLVRETLFAFQYFHIVEAKESPGLAWRAARLGAGEAAPAPAADLYYAATDELLR